MSTDNITVIARDCFARFDYVRRRVLHNMPITCDWCGSDARKLATGDYRLYQYGTWEDNKPNPCFDKHTFCCVDCYRSYNE